MYRLRQGRLEDDAALTKFCTAVEPSEPAQAVTMDNNIESFSELLTFLVRPGLWLQSAKLQACRNWATRAKPPRPSDRGPFCGCRG